MDLDERLCDYIQAQGGDAAKCGIGYAPAEGKISLQQNPGSQEVGQPYFNGNKQMAMNFEVSTNTKNFETARAALAPIADAISNATEEDIKSQDGSFIFDHATISGYAFNQLVDASGNIYWITNFVVYITKIYENE